MRSSAPCLDAPYQTQPTAVYLRVAMSYSVAGEEITDQMAYFTLNFKSGIKK
ncbi:MAG: hypothetical protein JW991_00860 [Candidatus Pacebacteria bacterium]|nr:hypothetical protein [Candidatus Paceibacterota bacterium]